MERMVIEGGKVLNGEIYISGSKNSTLPIMAACILFKQKVTLTNVPLIKDILSMSDLLRNLGVSIDSFKVDDDVTHSAHNEMIIDASTLLDCNASYDVVRKMRASILVLAPLLNRFGKATVSMPGGCAIGVRPINLHLDAMRALGAHVEVANGYVEVIAPKGGLVGGTINFPFPSVGATENALCAAVVARGTTVINNAAMEPEIIHLSEFLQAAGAKIYGTGTTQLIIEGVDELKSLTYDIPGDRIEAGTYAIAAAATHGKVLLKHINIDLFNAARSVFDAVGIQLEPQQNGILVYTTDELKPCEIITAPYPGFPTDLQAQMMSLLSIVPGSSNIIENIFESRLIHAAELMRMGAHITIHGHQATVTGVKNLSGTSVMASDLRASASLIIAGLIAKGTTVVRRIYHLDRGYESLVEKLTACGCAIYREKDIDIN
jgi:UDP-N-acetylglucosamine 1-carboxyvinyltransferase